MLIWCVFVSNGVAEPVRQGERRGGDDGFPSAAGGAKRRRGAAGRRAVRGAAAAGAQDVCRLRGVCRSWRALTTDATFVAAHAARHRGPLLAGGVLDFDAFPSVDVLLMDLSGSVVKRIRHAATHLVLPTTNLDLLCVTEVYTCRATLLNPIAGAAVHLPEPLSTPHSLRGRSLSDFDGSFKYGRDSNGDYKVLRVLTDCHNKQFPEQLFEILSLDESSRYHMRWRAKKALPMCVRRDAIGGVVINGVVYFLLDGRPNGVKNAHRESYEMDHMALFDLCSERWISYLEGPMATHPEMNNIDEILPEPLEMSVYQNLSLSELSGALVVAQYTDYRSAEIKSYVDLWYLMDSEKQIWEKKYRIVLEMDTWDTEHIFPHAHPSLILDDGRILIYITVHLANFEGQYTRRVMRLYDPETDTLGSDLVDVKNIHSIGFFSGSLLSIQNGQGL